MEKLRDLWTIHSRTSLMALELCDTVIIYYTYIYIYAWTSLVGQLVKNPPAMQDTPDGFLGQEDPLEKGQATHFNILGLPWWLR